MKTVWVGSEQRKDAEWYVSVVFVNERKAKLWMYEKTNRTVEEIPFVEIPFVEADFQL